MTNDARDRLISEGARLMAEKGFGGASVREICKAAGTSPNMIHHYFGDKNGLRQAIIDAYDSNVFALPMQVLERPAQTRDDLAARLQLLFDTTLQACIDYRALMMVALREQAQLTAIVAYQEKFVQFLKAAQDEGLVRPELRVELVSGLMLDRITNYVEYAPWVERTFGHKPLEDAAYRRDWADANLDLILAGFLN